MRKIPGICSECGITLQYAYNLKRHKLNCHVPEELKCIPCKLSFPAAEEAEKHKATCTKKIGRKKKSLFEYLNKSEKGAATKMNFIAYDHPLMKIPSLDAPAKTPSGRRRIAKRRNKWTKPLIPRQPQRTLTMATRSSGKLPRSTTNELKLSDSESSDSEEGKCQDIPVPPDHDSTRGDSEKSNGLLEDLKLSSDDESNTSDTSEMTAPSASDDEETACCKPAEPLTSDGLSGKGYFWIQPAPGPSVLQNFRDVAISDKSDIFITRFKELCRDLPIDRACLMFADKLKQLPIKRCIDLLGVYYHEFEYKIFGMETDSMGIFARIVMTLLLHFYRKNHFEVAGQLLKFLESKRINPFVNPPVLKEDDFSLGPSAPKEADLVIMCCTVYLEIRDTESALNFLMRPLAEFIQKNNMVALDALKPLLHNMFHRMIESQNNVPLLKLFTHMYLSQVDTKYPIDLSRFYDGVLSSLVTSSSQSERKLAIGLFESITQFSLLDSESSEIPSRALLTVAAEQRLPRARLAKILMACMNKRAYPSYDFENFSLKFYSSMTKIEMQVYLEQYLFYCARRVKSGLLKLKPCLMFEVVVTTNSARNYKYPVHRKILNVDHSHPAALSRLSEVLHHCLNIPSAIPVDYILQPYHEGRFIMFEKVVDQLFRHVLKADDVESFDEENCIFCYNCT